VKLLIINRHLEEKTGGSELQCDIIARHLQQMGHEVTYLALRSGRERWTAPYRVVPLAGDEPESIARAAVELAPELIYWRYNTRGLDSALDGIQPAGIPVLFSVSNRNDLRRFRPELLLPGLRPGKTLENWHRFSQNLQNHRALYRVDGIANQCRELMGQIKGVPEIYFPNSMPDRAEPFRWPRPYCAWVANLKDRKRPGAFIRLVRELRTDNVDFLMAGEIQQRRYERVRDRSNLPDNLHYLGELPVEQANGLIQNALMVIHTCKPEGFPNVFIQAWYYGKPVVSLSYDPDKFIREEGIGFHSGSFRQFKKDVIRLLGAPELREQMGSRAVAFARRQFDPETNIARLEAFMRQLVEAKP